MNSFKTRAIIVKRRNFSEKDRILTLFSEKFGKIEGLAKGARRPGNRLSANSDLATIANFHIHKTRSIDIITEIEPIFHPDGLRGQFEETQKIGFALKVIDKLFELDEPYYKTYQSLLDLIEAVSSQDRQLLFIKFILDILDDLGTLPNFSNCPTCHKPIGREEDYIFSFQGGLTHEECLDGESCKINENEIKLLRLVSSRSASEIKNIKVSKEIFTSAYLLIANYFNHQFGKILPDEVM